MLSTGINYFIDTKTTYNEQITNMFQDEYGAARFPNFQEIQLLTGSCLCNNQGF
jgi:hypothetical protein